MQMTYDDIIIMINNYYNSFSSWKKKTKLKKKNRIDF